MTALLRLGSRGTEVFELKLRLRELGYWPHVNVGDVFDGLTAEAVGYFQQTHLDQHGRPLHADEIVGPATRWALEHPNGAHQRLGLDAGAIPAGLEPLRQQLLEVALAQHDLAEDPLGSNRGPIDKFVPSWARGSKWCCFFVSWCDHEARGSYLFGRVHGSCTRLRAEAVKAGLYTKAPDVAAAGAALPRPGDAFLLRSKGRGPLAMRHVGLVYRVDPERWAINTIEGNCANRVAVRERSLLGGDLDGWVDMAAGEHGDGWQRGLVAAKHAGPDTPVA